MGGGGRSTGCIDVDETKKRRVDEAKKGQMPSCMDVSRRERCAQSRLDEKKREAPVVAHEHV
jgi:hypothetical protein